MSSDACWVLVESQTGRISRESLEALSAARVLTQQTASEMVALWVGAESPEVRSAYLASVGVRRVRWVGEVAAWDPACEGLLTRIEALYRCGPPLFFLFGPTPLSLSLAPRLAAHVGAGYACRITNLRSIGGRLVMTRPLVQGTLSELLRFPAGRGGLICLSPRSFDLPKPFSIAEPLPLAVEDAAPFLPARPSSPLFEILESVREPASRVAIEDAEIVIAGGRGMRSREGFALLEQLAELLGGAVGASRIAVDLGWAPKEKLIGQTGAKVAPDLYIACGISGAHQHLQGMKHSRAVLAINTDPMAPIFRIATWGIVADAGEVIREILHRSTETENRHAATP